MTRTAVGLGATAVLLALSLTGCAVQVGGGAGNATGTVPTAIAGTVTVFAAASLAGTFDALAAAFQAANPGVSVVASYGGSSGLAEQLVQGAPADVFAAASAPTMTTVTAAGLAATPTVFATNILEIAVPVGNPGRVTGLSDFAKPQLVIALCAAEVPCGAAARTVLAAAGVVASVDTLDQDVRSVLTRVELGEVDAGLVYRTDVLAAGGKVTGVEFPGADAAATSYPIVALAGAKNPRAAAAFVAFVLSSPGQAILRGAGFGAP